MENRPENEIEALVPRLTFGPVAVIRDEDGVALSATLSHVRALGFPNCIVLTSSGVECPDTVHVVQVPAGYGLHTGANALIARLPDRWFYCGYNAEFFFYPFCENRSVADMAQFVIEERRDSVFCTTVDLYPSDTAGGPRVFDPEDAYIDHAGYYSKDRYDDGARLERQIEVFGGLKWRYAEHIPWHRQRIDRIAFFRSRAGLEIDENGLLNDPEYNTVSCPWHHSLTGAVASFRVAKSLMHNPGSTFDVDRFVWSQSRKFNWSSQHLMDIGLMEPGQWF